MFRCSACGMEYSYGRILSHECGECIIHHGFLFEEERKYYEWNPNPIVKYSEPEIATPKKYTSEGFSNLDKEHSELEQRNHYQWNCETLIGINLSPISESHLNCFLIYE